MSKSLLNTKPVWAELPPLVQLDLRRQTKYRIECLKKVVKKDLDLKRIRQWTTQSAD